jgi:gluconolactonase
MFSSFPRHAPPLTAALAAILLATPGAPAAEPGADVLPTVGSIERLDPRFDALVPPAAVIEVLASGFAWSEGPAWVSNDRTGLPAGSLLFSDIPHNRIHRWQPGKGLDIFMEPAGFTGPAGYGNERGSNGLTLDREGRLICCEHGDRRVSRLEPTRTGASDSTAPTTQSCIPRARFTSPTHPTACPRAGTTRAASSTSAASTGSRPTARSRSSATR